MQFQRFGLVALLALVAVIAYFDIQRLINHQFPVSTPRARRMEKKAERIVQKEARRSEATPRQQKGSALS